MLADLVVEHQRTADYGREGTTVKLDLDLIERNAEDPAYLAPAASRPVVLALIKIARAATAFIDEQGKSVAMTPDGDMVLSDRNDFAGEQFAMLLAAVPEEGR